MSRVTALDMANGLGGWKLEIVDYERAKKLSIVWYTFPPKPGKKVRIHGHVSLMIEDVYDGRTRVAHSCQSKGISLAELEPGEYLHTYISLVKSPEAQ